MRRTEGQGSPQVAGARWVVLGHFRHRPKPRVEVDGEVFGTGRTRRTTWLGPSGHGAPADRRLTGSGVPSEHSAARSVRGSLATTSS